MDGYTHTNIHVGQGSTSHKLKTRRKRVRSEPAHIDKTIFTKDGPRLLSSLAQNQEKGKESSSKAQTHGKEVVQPVNQDRRLQSAENINPPMSKNTRAAPVSTKTKDNDVGVVTSHGISTAMPVQIIGPNRLRFVEDPKPPDPTMDGVGDMDMEGVNVAEE